MTNTYKTSAQTTGLNVEGNEIVLPDGSLAVADNALISRENIIEQRFGFRKCGENLPASKPESMFVTGYNIYVHINNQLWTSSGNCTYTKVNGLSTSTLNLPMAIYYFNGLMYFTQVDDVIRGINLNTLSVTFSAGVAGVAGSTDGIGAAATFNNPFGVYFDSTYAYICDSFNYTIRRMALATNTVTTIAGMAGVSGSADGVGAAARFNTPYGIWGNGIYLYIVDSINYTIRRLEIATNTVTTIAGMAGVSGSADGVGAAARFYEPCGIWGNSTYLFIVDSRNNTIRRLEISTNTVTTIAGTAGVQGETDGLGNVALFNRPKCITGDSGFLYLTDYGNLPPDGGFIIRKINISTTEVSTMAGGIINGNNDGNGINAKFDECFGITNDNDFLYVADRDNNAIRRISKSTNEVSYFAGFYSTPGNNDGNILTILSGPNG